jgi:hypothetical protein
MSLSDFGSIFSIISLFIVANEYGWLDFSKVYYDKHYKFYPPMKSPPPKDHIALNIEALLGFKTMDIEK